MEQINFTDVIGQQSAAEIVNNCIVFKNGSAINLAKLEDLTAFTKLKNYAGAINALLLSEMELQSMLSHSENSTDRNVLPSSMQLYALKKLYEMLSDTES